MTEFNLVERICKGGCDRKFKVMEKSDQWYARKDCQHICFGVPRSAKERKTVLLPSLVSNRKDRAKHFVDEELEALYDRLVGHAKKMEHKDDGSKLDVAFFAIEAKRLCGTAYPDFAKRVNVKSQDLVGWISVYERIASVLPSESLKTYKLDFLVGVAKDMRDGMSKAEVLHLLQVKLHENEIHNLIEYKGQLEDMRTYFMGKNLDHLNKKELVSIHDLIKDLSKKFRFWSNGRP